MTNSEKIYVGLCILFSTLIILGNLMYQKFVMLQIPFHKFELSAGAILYPLTFLITDIITELYGKEKANFCIRLAIYMNILVTIIIIFISYLPATEWSKINDETFNKVFSYYSVAFLASIIACYIAQAIDVNLYLWIRKSTNGKYLWLRSNVSTCISLFIDTTIVISFMAAFSIFPVEQIWKLIINSYSWKLFFTICCTPLFYLSLFCIRYFIKFEEVKDLGGIFAKHKKNTKASFEEIRDKAWMESICTTSERNICHSRESGNPGKKSINTASF